MLLTLLNGKGFKVPFGSDWIIAAVARNAGWCRCKQGRMMLFFFGKGGRVREGPGRSLRICKFGSGIMIDCSIFFWWILCHISDFTQKDPRVVC